MTENMLNLMRDHADNDICPYDLGLESYMPFRISVDDEGHADIIWREELRFHRELADADHENYGGRMPPWSQFTVDNLPRGWLTPENEEILVAELRKLTGIEDIETTEDGDADPDGDGDGYVAFSVRTDYLPNETVSQWVDRIGWGVIATLINATDPGTFNYPYLFSAMLYREAS